MEMLIRDRRRAAPRSLAARSPKRTIRAKCLGALVCLAASLIGCPTVAHAEDIVNPSELCFGEVPTIRGTPLSDVLYGTEGNDVIIGRGGNDTIVGRGGSDLICGGYGADRLDGGGGDDWILGGEGNDYLNGGDGPDYLVDVTGTDDFNGGAGNDVIRTSWNLDTGPDRISSGTGDDDIDSYNGFADLVVDCGAGQDRAFQAWEGDPLMNCEVIWWME